MKKIIVANWKINLGIQESVDFVKKFKKGKLPKEAAIALAPSLVALSSVAQEIKGTSLGLAAQDVFWQTKGAFTGEVSPLTLKELGVSYVIVGHSERRIYLKETDEMIAKKVKIVMENGLTPILCVGENFEQRQGGQTEKVIEDQVTKGLSLISSQLLLKKRLVVAYEPVWAISSQPGAHVVDLQDVMQAHQKIRQLILNQFSKTTAHQVQIIYGGSVNSKNISSFLKTPEVEGFLVGGAALDPKEFLAVVNECH